MVEILSHKKAYNTCKKPTESILWVTEAETRKGGGVTEILMWKLGPVVLLNNPPLRVTGSPSWDSGAHLGTLY